MTPSEFREAVESALAAFQSSPRSGVDLDYLISDLTAALSVKRCSCGRHYTRREFLSLPPPPKGDRQVELALRNCACGSTLALEAP